MKHSVTFSTFARTTFSIVIFQRAALNFHNLKTKRLSNQLSAKLELMESKQTQGLHSYHRTKETKVKMMLKSFLTGPDQA